MAIPDLRAGVAGGDITPPVGIHMGGYWGRKSGATAVHDALAARVLVFECGSQRVGLASLDLVGLDAGAVARIRRGAAARAGVEEAGFMVCCTHTHAGPLSMSFRGMGEVDLQYLQSVEERVVELAAAAVQKLEPARLSRARVPVQIGHNRRQQRGGQMVIGRNEEGSVVPWAQVLRVDGEEGLLATLFVHACHPVVLGGNNHQISGDFAGAARRRVEAASGRPALFVNGACGDINPRHTGATFAETEALGGELADAVLGGLERVQAVGGRGLGRAGERVALPLVEPPSRLQAETEKLVLKLKAELKSLAGGDVWSRRVPEAHLQWAEDLLGWMRAGREAKTQPFEIQAIALGDLVLLGMEGEIFARYQLDLEGGDESLFLCGYANGCIGYVPTADEYARGGYEIDTAYKVYASVLMIAPESEGIIRARARELVERARG